MSAQTTAEPSPAAAAAAASQKGAAGGAKGSYVPPETHSFVVSGTRFEVEKKYKLIKPIGHGAYGVVVACEDTTTGEKVAIKKIPHAFDDLVDAKRILREIKLLQHFCHENVISIIDIPVPKTVTEFEDVYIICTLMETDLHRIIYSKQDLSPDHVQYFVYQILRALKYMHSADVIHRDLKPSNLLLNANCDLRVCDFGLARGLSKDNNMNLTEYVVTRWYRAPEIMLSCQNYSKAVDVWSVGCIFAELLGRKPIFPGDDYIHQLQKIVSKLGTPEDADLEFVTSDKARKFMKMASMSRQKVPWDKQYPKADKDALDLLERMLQFNPAKRISVDEALEHAYMEPLHSPTDEPNCESKFGEEDLEFERQDLTKLDLQVLVFKEACNFHPAAASMLRDVKLPAKTQASPPKE